MKIIEIQYFFTSLVLMMLSLENIYLNLADIFFKIGNFDKLVSSLSLSVAIFLIGNIILFKNNKIAQERSLDILKLSHAISLLYVSIILLSDAIEIWVNLFIVNAADKTNLNFSFILCFLALIFLIFVKNLKFHNSNNLTIRSDDE